MINIRIKLGKKIMVILMKERISERVEEISSGRLGQKIHDEVGRLPIRWKAWTEGSR